MPSLWIILGLVGSLICIVLIVVCCRRRRRRRDRPSRSNSLDSFQQLYFTKPAVPCKSDRRVIERWSFVEQPSLTFYRVYIQDDPDELYRPVSEERARALIEQSKAMQYTGLELIFF